MYRVLLLGIILNFSVSGLLFGQQHVVYKKDGSIIKGEIVEQKPGETIKLETRDGSLFVFKMGDIERIETNKAERKKNSQDVVYKKDGSILRGMIVEQVPNDVIKLETRDGSLFVIKSADIDRITLEQAQNQAGPTTKSTSSRASPFKVSSLFGYGTSNFVLNPYAFGIGLRGYAVMQNGLSVGGSFTHHFGSSESESFALGSVELSLESWQISGEVGYQVKSEAAIVHPYLNFGYLIVVGDVESDFGSSSGVGNSLFLAPAISVTFPVTPRLHIGPDIRYLIGFESSDDNGLLMYLRVSLDR